MNTHIIESGPTEKKMLLGTLLNLSKWAISLTRNLIVVEESLKKNFGLAPHWYVHEELSRDQLVNALYEAKVLGWGVGHYIKSVYEDTDKRSMLPRVLDEVTKIKEMCEGKQSLPVEGYTYEESRKCLGKQCFDEYCVVRIDGIPEFFYNLLRNRQTGKYIRSAIEHSFRNGRKIALLFNSKDAFEVVHVNCFDLLDDLKKDYPGIRFLYKEEMVGEWKTDKKEEKVSKGKNGKK